MDNKQSFDDIIKNKIGEAYGLNPIRSDWDKMSSKINKMCVDNLPLQDQPNTSKNAQIVKQSDSDYIDLTQKEGISNAQNKIDNIFFDSAIKNTLEKYSTSLPQQNWSLLLRLFNERNQRRHMILKVKSMELAVLVLFFTVMYRWPFGHGKYYNTAENHLRAYYNSSAFDDTIISLHHTLPAMMIVHTVKTINKKNQHQMPSREKTTTYTSNEKKITVLSGLPSIDHHVVSISLAESIQPYIEKEPIEFDLSNHTTLVDNINPPFTPLSELRTISHEPYTEYAISIPMQSAELKTSREGYYMNMWTGLDFNSINTPFDKVYSVASYERDALNNNIGVAIGKKTNNLQFEIGGQYTRKSYVPEKIVESYGRSGDIFFEKSLDEISFDALTLPLIMKYKPFNFRNVHPYLVVGSAMSLIAFANYDIKEYIREDASAIGNNRMLPTYPRLENKTFSKGLFEGGHFKDNYFISGLIGFGVETSLYNNVSTFIQPLYQRQLFSNDIGIGPNKDKKHTVSLQFGIQYMLK